MNQMTRRRGFSGEGGLVSHGRRALRPKRPETLATGTLEFSSIALLEPEASAIIVGLSINFFSVARHISIVYKKTRLKTTLFCENASIE